MFGCAVDVHMFFYCNRLMEHENDPDMDEPYVPPADNVLGSTVEQTSPQSPSGTTECMFFSSINILTYNPVYFH